MFLSRTQTISTVILHVLQMNTSDVKTMIDIVCSSVEHKRCQDSDITCSSVEYKRCQDSDTTCSSVEYKRYWYIYWHRMFINRIHRNICWRHLNLNPTIILLWLFVAWATAWCRSKCGHLTVTHVTMSFVSCLFKFYYFIYIYPWFVIVTFLVTWSVCVNIRGKMWWHVRLEQSPFHR